MDIYSLTPPRNPPPPKKSMVYTKKNQLYDKNAKSIGKAIAILQGNGDHLERHDGFLGYLFTRFQLSNWYEWIH